MLQPVISGMGIISTLGCGCDETLQNLFDTPTPPGKSRLLNTDLNVSVFEIDDFRTSADCHNRTFALLQTALAEAMTNANLSAEDLANAKVAVVMGTTVASQLNDIEFYRCYRDGIADKKVIRRFVNGNLAEAIKKQFNLSGVAVTINNACSSGSDAIGFAGKLIASGEYDMVIAGGADEINKVPLAGFCSLGIVSGEHCKPFDKNRSGLNLGEGAGCMILESPEHAGCRGVRSRLQLSGYGAAVDAYHLTAPDPEGIGLETAIRQALQQAGLSSGRIGFINAHGTATENNDLTEAKVLKRVFSDKVKFLSTKHLTGHTLGAAGAIEAIFTALMLQNRKVPASGGFDTIDERMGVKPITELFSPVQPNAMSTSLAFGGCNCALIISRMEM